MVLKLMVQAPRIFSSELVYFGESSNFSRLFSTMWNNEALEEVRAAAETSVALRGRKLLSVGVAGFGNYETAICEALCPLPLSHLHFL